MRLLKTAALMLVLVDTVGCTDPVTIATWINVQEGSVLTTELFGAPQELPLEGGAFIRIDIDASNPLKIEGTIDVEQVRMGGQGGLFGNLCIRKDRDNLRQGSLSFDLLRLDQELEFPFAVVTSSSTFEALGFGEVVTEATPEGLDFPLNIALVEAAVVRGTVDQALELPVALESELNLSPSLMLTAILDLVLLSSSTPPAISPAVEQACSEKWAIQGREVDYVINPKSTYLRTVLDKTQPETVIDLAELGAEPGDTLKLQRKGAFKQGGILWDGTRVSAVFSSSDIVLDNGRRRVPGALEAGSNVKTPRTEVLRRPTDIAEDFEIPHGIFFVEVPPGATHLFLSPIDDFFRDNYSFELRIGVEVKKQ